MLKLASLSCNMSQSSEVSNRESVFSLCRAPSNRVRGAPFRPVRAMAVDLFPQTPHCETVLLFERVDYSSTAQKDEDQHTDPKPETS